MSKLPKLQHTICNKSCKKCFPMVYTLLENQNLADHPLAVYIKNKRIDPKHCNGVLLLSNMHITSIFSKTLVYQNIKELNISNNPISWLPDIYSLEKLNCSNCEIRFLPYMPKCKELDCSDNLITNIPSYSLKKLNCSNNWIKQLPQSKLAYLICNNNPITNINIKTLTSLEAYACPLVVVYKISSLSKRSTTLQNNTMNIIQYSKYRVNLDKCLINWNNNTCSAAIYNRLCESNCKFIRKLAKFLLRPK